MLVQLGGDPRAKEFVALRGVERIGYAVDTLVQHRMHIGLCLCKSMGMGVGTGTRHMVNASTQ